MKPTNAGKTKPEAGPCKMADGGGMYLEMMPNGSQYWRMTAIGRCNMNPDWLKYARSETSRDMPA